MRSVQFYYQNSCNLKCEKCQFKSLLLHKINQQKKKIENFNWKIEKLSSALQQRTGKLAWIGVKNFIKNCQQQESCTTQKVHFSILKDLI